MHLLIACVAGLLLLSNAGSDANKKAPMRPEKASAVKLVTADKLNLKGDLLLPTNTTKEYPRVGAVILVHGQESDRSQLWALQRKVTDWGAATLTLDLRGYGESAAAGVKPSAKPSAAAAKKVDDGSATLNPLQEDIKSAIAFLRKQKNIDPSRISLLGVDLGAAASLRVAIADLSIKGVGFVSPETEIAGFQLKEEAKKLSPRSMLLVAPLGAKDLAEGMANDLASSMKIRAIVIGADAKGAGLLEVSKTTEPKMTTDMGLKMWLNEIGALTPGP